MKVTFDELHQYCVKHKDFFQKHFGDEVIEKEDFWDGVNDFLGYHTKLGRWAAVMYGVYVCEDHITIGEDIPGRPELHWGDRNYESMDLMALESIPEFIGTIAREQEGYFNYDEDISICQFLGCDGDEQTDMCPHYSDVYGIFSWWLRKEKGWKTYDERNDCDWKSLAKETWNERAS